MEPLTAENVLWSNTVLAAGSAVGFVIYTGAETRAVMNTSHPGTKVGLLDLEINRLAKVRCVHTASTPRASTQSIIDTSLDPVRGHVCALCCTGCVERLPRPVVRLRFPVPHSVLFHHPNQVRDLVDL